MVRPLRILHVLEPPDGGVPRYVRSLTSGLIQRGHEISAIVSRRGPIASDLRNLGADVTCVDFVPEMLAPLHDVRALRQLLPVMRRREWDVVHTHGNKAGVFARPIARLIGLPDVHSPHSFAYTTQRIRPRRGAEVRRLVTLGIEKALAPCSQTIVAASEEERDTAIGDHVAAPRRFTLVRYGVDPSPTYAPDAVFLELRGRAPLVGYCGRLSPEKGPLLFVEALAILASRGVPFTAAIVGDGPLEREVRSSVADAKLDDRVAVRRFSDVGSDVLGALDVFVLPSRWESLPIAILEAMAAGLPVVAADVGGVHEAVIDGQTGFLTPRDDASAVADAVQKLLGDTGLRRRMGEAGREVQQRIFGYDRMIDEMVAVYRAVLERSSGRRRMRNR